MTRRVGSIAVLCVVQLFLFACTGSPTTPSDITSIDALLRALRRQGVSAARHDNAPPQTLPCLSVPGALLDVSTATVTAFEYPTMAAADADAAMLQQAVIECLVLWISTPHFY